MEFIDPVYIVLGHSLCLFLLLGLSYHFFQPLKFLLHLLFRKLIQDGRPFGTTFDSGMI